MDQPDPRPAPAAQGPKSGPLSGPAFRHDGLPEFDRIPHFFSARVNPDYGLRRNTNAAGRVPFLAAPVCELLASALAGFCAGAVFVLILTWEVAR